MKRPNRQVLRKSIIRHPLHWLCGIISGACLFHPETTKAVTGVIITFVSFLVYEWWENEDIGDQGWRDWWEFITALFVVIAIWLIKGLVV